MHFALGVPPRYLLVALQQLLATHFLCFQMSDRWWLRNPTFCLPCLIVFPLLDNLAPVVLTLVMGCSPYLAIIPPPPPPPSVPPFLPLPSLFSLCLSTIYTFIHSSGKYIFGARFSSVCSLGSLTRKVRLKSCPSNLPWGDSLVIKIHHSNETILYSIKLKETHKSLLTWVCDLSGSHKHAGKCNQDEVEARKGRVSLRRREL